MYSDCYLKSVCTERVHYTLARDFCNKVTGVGPAKTKLMMALQPFMFERDFIREPKYKTQPIRAGRSRTRVLLRY